MLLCWLLAAPSRADESLAIILVVVNDLPRADDLADRGGLAKLATIIKNERAAGRQVVVTHAGNAISPSPWTRRNSSPRA